jgi:hypothetical protein
MTTKINTSSLKSLLLLLLGVCSLAFYTQADTMAKRVVVNVYGHLLSFDLQGDFYQQRSACFNDSSLAENVERLMVDPQSDSLIKQMNKYAAEFGMDDMAFLMLLNKVSDVVMKDASIDCKTLFKYTILQKKGFDVFIGYSQNTTTLYGRTNFMVDNCLFITRGTKRYFDLSFNQQQEPHAEQMFVIRHEGKSLPIVMNMIAPPAFHAKQSKKVMPFDYDGYVYFFTAKVNQSLVDYYKDLPTININTVYLNYGLSATATESLVKELQRATSYMNTTESVNFLLRFVQTAFEYKKDEQVYGQEKFSFPEETLMNPYSDCEDKAMLYAVLVNKVLGLKTVALYYKDAKHINIAIENWSPKSKGNFSFKNHDYVVCEPSGKGFNIGESPTELSFASLIDW